VSFSLSYVMAEILSVMAPKLLDALR
jgi:hypothetical protein